MRTAYWKQYAEEHPTYHAIRWKRIKDKINAKRRIMTENDKLAAVRQYSAGTMACANPYGEHKEPYVTIDALSIDHIDGGGAKHRKGLTTSNIYRWLIKNNFPTGFQVLCMNCQFIKKKRNREFGKAGKKSLV